MKAPCLTSLSVVTEFEGPSKKEKKTLQRKVFEEARLGTLDWDAVNKGTPALCPCTHGPVLCLAVRGIIFSLACQLQGLFSRLGTASGPMLACLVMRNKAPWISPFSMVLSTSDSHGNTGRQVALPTLQRRRPRRFVVQAFV